LNPKSSSAAPLLQPLLPQAVAAAMSRPSSMVRAQHVILADCGRPDVMHAAYDALIAEFVPPITAAAQAIKNAGKRLEQSGTCAG
jgi:hypothetical protein